VGRGGGGVCVLEGEGEVGDGDGGRWGGGLFEGADRGEAAAACEATETRSRGCEEVGHGG
jgi:hypothetical protein